MLSVLRVLAKPWRWPARLRTALAQLSQVLDLQREVQKEVRELHQSSLLAAIHIIEAQERVRAELTQHCARLEQRIEALEQQLAAQSACVGLSRAA